MRKLYRDRWDKKLGGVCGGLGQYFQVDPTFIRLIAVSLLFISFGLVILAYIALWVIMPEGPRAYMEIKGRKLYRSRKNRMLAGVCGGVAECFKIDATIVRIAFVVLLFLTGILPLLVTYLVAAAIIPEFCQ